MLTAGARVEGATTRDMGANDSEAECRASMLICGIVLGNESDAPDLRSNEEDS
eukprot:CAMPEP_0182824114 /NCGR_PEP_ID=MMETSP0006_2-20121128/15118_1 /TAXON_ID=97485 /ORGANISM="Prymnesium parvum, Strain Texoma1" /LENGTH=52 /DNA_ID=CAMNT_0024951091 /DNA_START=47 /DNA_END=201 /DNA_ORIENTATION=-